MIFIQIACWVLGCMAFVYIIFSHCMFARQRRHNEEMISAELIACNQRYKEILDAIEAKWLTTTPRRPYCGECERN